jgi:uncharacterized membrane protein
MAFVLAVLTRAPVAMSVVPDSTQRLVESGSALQARYLVSVANRRRQPDSFRLEVGGLPGGSATIDPAVLPVAPGREQRAVLMVDLPRDQVTSGLYRFTVTATSQADRALEVEKQATLFVP